MYYERGGALNADFPRWGSETNIKEFWSLMEPVILMMAGKEVFPVLIIMVSVFS